MRCPYCQAINQERAIYCARCGWDMRQPLPPQPNPPYQRQAPTPTPVVPLSEAKWSAFQSFAGNSFIASDTFTNGQFRCDRNVRLGSLTTNRYQIETGNGYVVPRFIVGNSFCALS